MIAALISLIRGRHKRRVVPERHRNDLFSRATAAARYEEIARERIGFERAISILAARRIVTLANR